MAIAERLTKRFRNVPGVTTTDVTDWIAEAETESGLTAGEADDNALLYLSYALGYESIATDAARYFTYKDGEESVDKTAVFANYMKLAEIARLRYSRYKGGGSSYMYAPARYDGR
jgi:hypothetical protein